MRTQAILRIEFSQSATDDARIAADWLDAVQPELGRAFLEAIDDVVKRLTEHPAMYQTLCDGHGVHGECRRAVLRRFDYALVYRILPDRIQVVGVLHCRLNPVVVTERALIS